MWDRLPGGNTQSYMLKACLQRLGATALFRSVGNNIINMLHPSSILSFFLSLTKIRATRGK